MDNQRRETRRSAGTPERSSKHTGDSDRVLRLRQVIELCGLARETIRREEAAGRFPRRRWITPGSVGWLSSEIRAWISTRPTEQPTVSTSAKSPK